MVCALCVVCTGVCGVRPVYSECALYVEYVVCAWFVACEGGGCCVVQTCCAWSVRSVSGPRGPRVECAWGWEGPPVASPEARPSPPTLSSRIGSGPGPPGLRKPGLLLAVPSGHLDLELRRARWNGYHCESGSSAHDSGDVGSRVRGLDGAWEPAGSLAPQNSRSVVLRPHPETCTSGSRSAPRPCEASASWGAAWRAGGACGALSFQPHRQSQTKTLGSVWPSKVCCGGTEELPRRGF